MGWIAAALIFLVGLFLLPLSAGNAAPANSIARGKKLLESGGCNHCHMVEGRGGTVAPPLDGIASFLKRDEIVERLVRKKPAGKSLSTVIPESLMDHVTVSRRDARLIADYLLTLKAPQKTEMGHGAVAQDTAPPTGSQFVPKPRTEASDAGARLYWEMGCIACHSIGPVGGELGPNLAGIGARRSSQFITNRILSGATLLPKPGEASSAEFAMPPQEICPEHAQKLTEFLLTLPPEASLYEPGRD